MSLINTIMRVLVDALLFPFRGLHPVVGLLFVSLVASVGILLVFRVASNQKALDQVKRKMTACLFEIRLLNDDMRAIFRAQFEMFRHIGRYFWLSLIPMLWLMIPLVLLIAQLQAYYGYEGFKPGDTAIVKLELSEQPGTERPEVTLHASDGIRIETASVWIPSERELSWRVAMLQPGDHQLIFEHAGSKNVKSVLVSDRAVRRSPVRPSSWTGQLLFPSEAAVSAPIEQIVINYADTDVWGMHWMILFFILVMVFAFALRKPLGVTI